MSLVPTSNDYTDKDFDSLRARLFALVQSVFPEWTDHNVADFGNILVELFCFVGDVLTAYQDNQAREAFLPTATQRKSIIGLCKLIGYAPPGARAATADVVFSIATPVAGDVHIPAGTVVLTEDITEPVQFQLLNGVTIPAGSVSVVGTVKNSKPAEDTFTSTGLANQQVTLSSAPYLDNSAVVVASNGEFTQVDNFLNSTATDMHFIVIVDQNDRATIRFGNGTNGAIPAGVIAVGYEVGGGASGNVESGAITRVTGVFVDQFGTPVQLRVTNPSRSVGGSDRASNAQIKAVAPSTIRAPTNCIAREDFEIHAKIPGVARALMLTSDEDPSIPENSGTLYIVPSVGGAPSAAMLADVTTQVTETYPPPLTFRVTVAPPIYRDVNVHAVVHRKHGASKAAVRSSIMAALSAWFSPVNADGTPNDRVDFGANLVDADGEIDAKLAWSDIFNAVRDAAGVRKIDPGSHGFLLNGTRADVTLKLREFPRLGAVTLVDGDTGEAF